LECPECDYFTLNFCSRMNHVRIKHATNPSLAGLALLCESGHESCSSHHSFVCPIANFTVIRKGEGPKRERTGRTEKEK
ncbi:hypothetical protein PENTCL1PPCAC_8223, partial [Pristionchus entomophagus]